MQTPDKLAGRFEEHRAHVQAVAYRMLGSSAEAEDAVQEAWIRLSRTDAAGIGNLRGWLTTVVARVCMDMLRARASRREESLEVRVPDPVIARMVDSDDGPEADAALADSVGLALLVVLEQLGPAERVAFVLRDVFALSFEEIAPVVGRSVVATRQLASRARRRVRGQAPAQDTDLRQQRRVVDAFLVAVRAGDFEALVALLDPDVVLRADGGAQSGMTRRVHGADAVVAQAAAFSKLAATSEVVLVNGSVGLVARRPDGGLFSVLGFTVAGGRVVALDILADPHRLERLDLSAVER